MGINYHIFGIPLFTIVCYFIESITYFGWDDYVKNQRFYPFGFCIKLFTVVGNFSRYFYDFYYVMKNICVGIRLYKKGV